MADEVTIILPADASPALIERLRAAFPDATISGPVSAQDVSVSMIETSIEKAVAAAPELPGRMAEWWAGLGGGLWPLTVLVVALLVGGAVEYAFRRLVNPSAPAGGGQLFIQRAPRAFRWGLLRIAGFLIFYVAASAVARLMAGGEALVFDIRVVLAVIVYARALFLVIDLLAADGAPERRLMGFTDDEAHPASRAGVVAIAVFAVSAVSRAAITLGTSGDEAGVLARIVLVAAAELAMVWFFWRLNGPVRAVLQRAMGPGPSDRPLVVRYLAEHVGGFYILMVALDFLIRSAGILGALGPGAAYAAGPTLLLLVLTPLGVAGLRVWRSETRYVESRPGRWRGFRAGAFAAAEGAIILGGAILLLRAWGIDPLAQRAESGIGRLLPGLVEGALSIVVGVALWRAASAILADPPAPEAGVVPDEEAVRTKTRMETILPILRSFLLATIGVVTALTALASLGVDIAPLLAGAGVMGLAIGFGAQRLVADIISGMFYLYEDAFRIGEYIETNAGKGEVERITLRSVVLRHHRGPVFTIPFSQMGTIQNHSRDWVKIKFSFDVPANTDLEMVRKMIKKIGVELEEDPEIKGKFLEPLKSQGAVGIKGRSYTISCKYTTRPGEQFLVRRKIYAALQKALQERGIELFAPTLTVATGDPTRPAAPAADAPV